MNKIILGIALVFISFWSCHKSSQKLQEKIDNSVPVASMISHQKSVEVNIDLNKDCLPFDSLMTKVSYVKLETTGDNLVGGISQILFVDDKIIIVDAEKSKSITVYDGKGHFLYKIGTLVQGLMEYGSLDHVAFTPGKEMLVITDLKSGRLKYYSIDGRYVKSVKLPYWFSRCEFITDNLIAGFSLAGNVISERNKKYKPLLIVTDLWGNISCSNFQSYYKKEFTSSILEPLRKFEDRVLYNNPNTDSIFLLTPNGIELAYHLNIKGAKPIVQNEDITNKLLDEQHQNNPFFYGDFIELKDGAIFYIYELGLKWYRFGIYSNTKQRTFSCNGLLQNPFFYFFTLESKARYKDNTVVVDMRPDIILAYRDELYRLGKKEEIDEFYKDLTEDSNPVLFFYELKF